MKIYKQFLSDFIHLLYPEICLSCKNELNPGEKVICIDCEVDIPVTRFGSIQQNPVTNIFYGRLPLLYADAWLWFRKDGITQKLLHQLKYKERDDVGLFLGQMMGYYQKKRMWLDKPDIIVPIPLHPKKEKIRGYNQADVLARSYGTVTGIPCRNDLLFREESQGSQTKLGRYLRWQNVQKSFIWKNIDAIPPETHILLIDDVITTGATLEAAARSLLAKREDIRLSVLSAALSTA